jgi:FecR protein
MTRTWVRLLTVGILLSGFAWAQEDDSNDADRGVARISLINGDVSIRRGDSGDVVAAAPNGPLVDADHLLTGPAARAEVQFDWANYLRLGTDTEVRIAGLENGHYQVQLARGSVTLAVIRDSSGQVEVQTPNLAFRPGQRGAYRIRVTDDGQSEVTVRAGDGQILTPRGSEAVQAGQTMMVRGAASDPEFQVVEATPMDDWDRWNQQRDQQLLSTRSYRHMSPDIVGGGDLDSNGRWVDVAPYGQVWTPEGVGPDWAPYRDGRWVWLDWYGWTWVSYDPWGWAPYHYGRWFFQVGTGWCWFPGPMFHHYYWHPALVSFFGWGVGGVGFGFGSIGWVPLGPHELFSPWYGRGVYGYRNTMLVNNARLTNMAGIQGAYRNARIGNGVSGVAAGGFAQGSRPGAVRFTGQEQVSSLRGPVPVAPTSASLRMSDRAARVMPAASGRTQFYSPRPAPAVQRIPFSAQRQGAEQYVQRSMGAAAARGGGVGGGFAGGVGGGAPAARTASGGVGGVGGGVGVAGGSSGWRQVPQPSAGQQTGNWRQFGQAPTQPQSNANWRGYGGQVQPAGSRSYPQYQAPRTYSPSGAVRINPPIARQRSQPASSGSHSSGSGHASSGGSGGGHSSGGGGGHSSHR